MAEYPGAGEAGDYGLCRHHVPTEFCRRDVPTEIGGRRSTVSEERRRRGKHARAARAVPGAGGRLLPVLASRRAQMALGGAAGLGLALVSALLLGRSGDDPRTAAVKLMSRQPVAASPAIPAPRRALGIGDAAAMAYYQRMDKAAARHVREILWTGPMLRVYTDLPASDADSRAAIALCEIAVAYLQGHGRSPVVFVHARKNDGYPVLANKLDVRDSCRLNDVP